MRRYLAAALILALLFLGCLLNARHVGKLTEAIVERTDRVCALAQSGAYAQALELAREAEELWQGAGLYTGVFVRHAESDAVSDALGDLFTALYGGDGAAARGAVRKLQAHLREIARMESVSFSTVF